jgi:hypothetical protein
VTHIADWEQQNKFLKVSFEFISQRLRNKWTLKDKHALNRFVMSSLGGIRLMCTSTTGRGNRGFPKGICAKMGLIVAISGVCGA